MNAQARACADFAQNKGNEFSKAGGNMIGAEKNMITMYSYYKVINLPLLLFILR